MSGEKIGEKNGDEGLLGGDLGEDGGGSEVVLQLGAVDAPGPHCHVDDVDRQTHGYNQEHHNCDENPPSLMASLNRRAVSCAGVDSTLLWKCAAHARSARALQELPPFLFTFKYFYKYFTVKSTPLIFTQSDTFCGYCDLPQNIQRDKV